jgi:hypothetical protein
MPVSAGRPQQRRSAHGAPRRTIHAHVAQGDDHPTIRPPRKIELTDTAPSPQPALSARRKLLLGVPFGLVALQGCGGASAATSPAPASASPAASPAPVSAVSGWAARPSAAGSTGLAIFVPDVGSTGSLWFSNGSAWVPASNPLTLAHKFSNASMDASVGASADVLLDSFTIPAYVLGPASGLRITAAYAFPGGGTANKAPQVRAYFGVGSYAASATALLDTRGQFSTQASALLNVTLQNANAMAANQVRPIDYGFGASGNPFQASTIDFTQDVTIGFGALNNSSSVSPADQQVLEWFSIEMLA